MTDIEKTIEEARAEMLPYESWERLAGETSEAFAAFCVFRDFGVERNIRKAVKSLRKDKAVCASKYSSWRNWAAKYRWSERTADYDRHIEKLKLSEVRKTIEAQGEKHRQVTGKMLDVIKKKLDLMNPEELTQGTVTEWAQTAIKIEREMWQSADADCLGVSASRNSTQKQGELNFVSDFQGL